MNYSKKQVGEKTFEITIDFKGEKVSFNAVVRDNESEIPDLVKDYIEFLEDPTPKYPLQDSVDNEELKKIVEEQAQKLEQLVSRLEALESV